MGDRLEAEFGDDVDVKYIWNVMDLGYQGGDLLWMAEHGILTLSYQSTSYLADRVPELELADLPFLFEDLEHARAAMDGKLGAYLSRKIEERIGYRVLGYFENGYRHVSNKLSPVRTPADLAGMRIRLMPGKMHAHLRAPRRDSLFSRSETGARGHRVGRRRRAGESPGNTVDYGAHKVHRYHTLTGHCYLSRGIYCNRKEFESWPAAFQTAMLKAAREAITAQRDLAVEEEEIARKSDRARRRRSLGADSGRARRVRPHGEAAARRRAKAIWGGCSGW